MIQNLQSTLTSIHINKQLNSLLAFQQQVSLLNRSKELLEDQIRILQLKLQALSQDQKEATRALLTQLQQLLEKQAGLKQRLATLSQSLVQIDQQKKMSVLTTQNINFDLQRVPSYLSQLQAKAQSLLNSKNSSLREEEALLRRVQELQKNRERLLQDNQKWMRKFGQMKEISQAFSNEERLQAQQLLQLTFNNKRIMEQITESAVLAQKKVKVLDQQERMLQKLMNSQQSQQRRLSELERSLPIQQPYQRVQELQFKIQQYQRTLVQTNNQFRKLSDRTQTLREACSRRQNHLKGRETQLGRKKKDLERFMNEIDKQESQLSRQLNLREQESRRNITTCKKEVQRRLLKMSMR